MISKNWAFTSGSSIADLVWVCLDGRPAVRFDRLERGTGREYTDAELEAQVLAYWDRRDYNDNAARTLQYKYPDLYVGAGPLPASDIAWDGKPAYGVYALKARRKNGKYQVAEFVEYK